MALRIRPTTSDEPDVTPQKGAHPLFWLLILVALLAIGYVTVLLRNRRLTPALLTAAGGFYLAFGAVLPFVV